jgi:hypothetical protein
MTYCENKFTNHFLTKSEDMAKYLKHLTFTEDTFLKNSFWSALNKPIAVHCI